VRISVGTTWAELYIRSEFGQSVDDPPEAQATYVALMHREREDSQWVVNGKAWVRMDLDDLDTAARMLADSPPDWATGEQRKMMRRNSRRIQRQGIRMKKTLHAFRGTLGATNTLYAYRAFRGRRSHEDDEWQYWPLRSLCPGGAQVEGTLWPHRITRPRRLRRYVWWEFIPAGQPVPPTGQEDVLRTRPAPRVAEIRR
jgi:hypothetical protein